MYILDTEGKTEEHPIVEIATKIEIISSHISLVVFLHQIIVAFIVIHGILSCNQRIEVDSIPIEIVELATLYIVGSDGAEIIGVVALNIGETTVVAILINSLVIRYSVLGTSIEIASGKHQKVEIATLMIVEAEIEKRLAACA